MGKHGEGVPIILSESEQLVGKHPVYWLIDDNGHPRIVYASSIVSHWTGGKDNACIIA
jgi:hypothetical protein